MPWARSRPTLFPFTSPSMGEDGRGEEEGEGEGEEQEEQQDNDE